MVDKKHITKNQMLCAVRQLGAIALLGLAPFLCGCQTWVDANVSKGPSVLKAVKPSTDSVTVEILWARVPVGIVQQELNQSLWQRVDESQLSLAVRRELHRNGFRAGVINGSPPEAIVQAFHLTAKKNEESGESDSLGGGFETNAGMKPMKITGEKLARQSNVKRRLLQLKLNRRTEIQVSDIYASIPIFQMENGELAGRTYNDAQGIYALTAKTNQDHTVQLELTPELHHGQPQLRFEGTDQGILRQMPSRNREVYSAMRMAINLAPGEMIVLMNTDESEASLGHHFHSVNGANGPERKIMLVRLAQVPESEFFAKSPNNWWPW